MANLFAIRRPDGELVSSMVGRHICAFSSPSAARKLLFREDRVEMFVPSPTWRPIAELPKEWRDGRWVAIVESAHRPWKAAQWDNGAWFDEDDCECAPTLFLDLTIPEVPRG